MGFVVGFNVTSDSATGQVNFDFKAALNTGYSRQVVNDVQKLVKKSDGSVLATTVTEQMLRYTYVKNDAQWFWWGVRIWLSKGTLTNIGAGVSITGIWLPATWPVKALSSLGALGGRTLIKGGIVSDMNWVYVTNVHWQ